MPDRVSAMRLDTANRTLSDLTEGDHPELTGPVRDAIAQVRSVLHDIAERLDPA